MLTLINDDPNLVSDNIDRRLSSIQKKISKGEIRDNDSVTYNIDIDYEKVDVKKIIELEGEEDNIFDNNKAKLSKYLEFSKKLGITCSESTL